MSRTGLQVVAGPVARAGQVARVGQVARAGPVARAGQVGQAEPVGRVELAEQVEQVEQADSVGFRSSEEVELRVGVVRWLRGLEVPKVLRRRVKLQQWC